MIEGVDEGEDGDGDDAFSQWKFYAAAGTDLRNVRRKHFLMHLVHNALLLLLFHHKD